MCITVDSLQQVARCEFLAGNFFESVPSSADALILKSVIHDWDDERSVKILANCRRALGPPGKLLLVERIMPDVSELSAEHRATVLSDLNMLRGLGGAERTEHEFRELLTKSGFMMTRVVAAGPMKVIEPLAGQTGLLERRDRVLRRIGGPLSHQIVSRQKRRVERRRFCSRRKR